LPSKWLSADYFTKQQIQFLIFPEGISYNKQTDGCRTRRVNTVFAYIAYLKQVFTKEKSGIPELNLEFAALVARRGLFNIQLNFIQFD
jgi:site-specific DNA recombinase